MSVSIYECQSQHGKLKGQKLKRALPLCWLVTQAPKGHFTQERLTQERLTQERLTQERLTQERLTQERLTQERLTQERLTQERLTQERLTQERLTQERLTQERLTQERLTQERLTQERLTQERLTQERHQSLLAQVQNLIPASREVIFLGDGEFDGCGLLQDITDAGWHYVCRTAKNTLLAEADWPEETFSFAHLDLQPGDCVEMPGLLFTAQRLGPVLAGAIWETTHKEPLLLVTNLDFLEEARLWYRKRFGIETFFSDQKSRGFYLCHSHLSDPARLGRLLMATCLAYYWLVCLGAEVVQRGWQGLIHRAGRCDLSLFQLGRTWLTHCLNEGYPVPVRLQVRHVK